MIEPRNLSMKFKPLLQLHAVLYVPESDFLFEFNSRHAEYYKVLLYIEKLFKLFLSILNLNILNVLIIINTNQNTEI